ncbi:MAG TPA: hydrogenase expression/formation protein HypE, partial [Methylocystis sp.]|nr:hydrogenase expression/formation protein HypE [Methylocystis sp.]
MNRIDSLGRKLDMRSGRVDLSHGSGGRAMARLIADIFHAAFDNDWLRAGNDQSAFDVAQGRMVMTTDGYVVSPLSFPGGDIGLLAVNGTINDIAMAGARPLYMSTSFIIEEGFSLAELQRIAQSMGFASRAAGVPIITGDTKVVERGKADGLFISTACVGVAPEGVELSGDKARPGDVVLLSGSIGDHGVAVMSRRQNLSFESDVLSDTAALHELVAAMMAAGGASIKAMRDPTRGGLAATLNEIAHQSRVGASIDEAAIPVKP